MEQNSLLQNASKFKKVRSQSAAKFNSIGLKEENPVILECNNSSASDISQLPNYKSLKFWKIISTDVQKSFLKLGMIKIPQKDFKLSHIDDFKFMFDETLEIQYDIFFKLQNVITGQTSPVSFKQAAINDNFDLTDLLSMHIIANYHKFQKLIQSKLKPDHLDYVPPPPKKQLSPQRQQKEKKETKKRKYIDIAQDNKEEDAKLLSPDALAKLKDAILKQKNFKRIHQSNLNDQDEQLSVISEYSQFQEESHVSQFTETIRSDSPVESDLENQQYSDEDDENQEDFVEEESKEDESPKTRNSSAKSLVQKKHVFNLKDNNSYLRNKLKEQFVKPIVKRKNDI